MKILTLLLLFLSLTARAQQVQTIEPLPILQVAKMTLAAAGKSYVVQGDLGGALVSVDLSRVKDPLPALRNLLNQNGLELVERRGVSYISKLQADSVSLPRLRFLSQTNSGRWQAWLDNGDVVEDGSRWNGMRVKVVGDCVKMGSYSICL